MALMLCHAKQKENLLRWLSAMLMLQRAENMAQKPHEGETYTFCKAGDILCFLIVNKFNGHQLTLEASLFPCRYGLGRKSIDIFYLTGSLY